MWDKPVKLPDLLKGSEDETIYCIKIRPFSDAPVGIAFKWVKAAPSKYWPDGWVPGMINIRGPQVDGIDLDATHVRIGPYFWSYREYIFSCLYGILTGSYGGKRGMENDYIDGAIKHPRKNVRYVNLDD